MRLPLSLGDPGGQAGGPYGKDEEGRTPDAHRATPLLVTAPLEVRRRYNRLIHDSVRLGYPGATAFAAESCAALLVMSLAA